MAVLGAQRRSSRSENSKSQFWLLLLFVGALVACDPARSSLGAPTADGAAPELVVSSMALPCSPTLCAASAGPCQVASCEDSSGLCRTSVAREGEACLPGNACGPARCHQGRCEPENPPPCRELVDECNDARCDPERGCVSQPRELPGSSCDHPAELSTLGISHANISQPCAPPARGLPGCWPELAGHSAHFELDLRASAASVPVTLLIDAGFEFEAALTRGPCGDPVLVQCASPYYADGRARRLSLTLPPDRYQLVVQAASARDSGLVQVAASVAEPNCGHAPSNDHCAAALPLDTSLAWQSVLGNTACATTDVPNYCSRAGAPDVFYRLDLSDRMSEIWLDVELEERVASLFAVSGAGAGATCGELMVCGSGFSGKLLPGVYALGVSADPSSSGSFSLGLGLGAPDCAQSSNTTWQTALELDPTLERQHIVGNTACGTNQVTTACNDDRGAPELYYRLDLRGQGAPRRVGLEGNHRASGLLSYLLHPSTAAEGPGPALVTACQANSPLSRSPSQVMYLAPRLYYLVIDGQVQSRGRFDLELSLSATPSPSPAPCLDYWLDRCLEDTEPACSSSRAAPSCLAAAVDCGLQPQLYQEFCLQRPGCCDGSAARETCAESWQSVAACP